LGESVADCDNTETFEGLALGARIAALRWESKAVKPWLMCLAYGCTYVQILFLALNRTIYADNDIGLPLDRQ
jgi:hypothetical protein